MCFILLHVTTRYLSVMGNAFILFIIYLKLGHLPVLLGFLFALPNRMKTKNLAAKIVQLFVIFIAIFFFFIRSS